MARVRLVPLNVGVSEHTAQEVGSTFEPETKPTLVRQIVRFLWHFGEMALAMLLGMFVFDLVYSAIMGPMDTGTMSMDNRMMAHMNNSMAMGPMTNAHMAGGFPEVQLLLMALAMTLPMVAWMWFRRHGWAHNAEMAGAMLVPALLLIGLYWLGLIPQMMLMSVYEILAWIAMLGIMLYCWRHYVAGRVPFFEK